MAKPRPNDITDDQIVEAYERLRSGPKVCSELGLGQATVTRVLQRRAIERTGSRANDWSERDYPGVYRGSPDDIIRMYQSGLSIRAVAERIGRSTNVVVRRLRNAGIKGRPFRASGRQHSMWSGGRIQDAKGYCRVWVSPDDPMASMRNGHGYVLEHRLIMARKLGRPLKRHETVHHINGDPTDNRRENLQLRQGKHGSHIAMECLDCGSHNVAAVPLKEQT